MKAQAEHGRPGAAADPPPPDGYLRMRDLVRESGLPRETIHFYKLQGLLPEPIKTGRNTALYTQEHLARLRHIRELQERQFLPLKAIRAILDESAQEDFTPEQEDLVRRVRATLTGWAHAQQQPTVPVSRFVPERVSRAELREFADEGLVGVHGSGPGARVSEDDAVILECWAQFKDMGFGPERGIQPADLGMHDESMQQLVKREARLVLGTYGGEDAEHISGVIEQIAPVIVRLLGAMHRKHIRQFLAKVGP
jgi:DNA-binding transcriptional MerR regulator